MDAVLNWLWQGIVVAAATWVMLRALDRAGANVRYVVCWFALVTVATLPAWPAVDLGVPAAAAASGDAIVALPDAWWTSALLLAGAWIAWTLSRAASFISAVLAIRRARAAGRPFPAVVEARLQMWTRLRSTRRRAALVLSDAVGSAAVLGWGAPVIAVSPRLLETLEDDELDRVVIHEWAHVQRRDDLAQIAQIAAGALVGWHPAVWWIERRLRIEREIACDEMTVALTGSPKSYAACLMKLATLRPTPRALRGAPAALSSSGLRARIFKLVASRPSIAPRWSRSLAAASVALLCLISAQLGGVQMVEAAGISLPAVSSRLSLRPVRHLAPVGVPPAALEAQASAPVHAAAPVSGEPVPQNGPAAARPSGPTPEPVTAPPAPAAAAPGPRATPALPDAPVTTPDLPISAAMPPLPSQPSGAPPAETARAPWTVAADGGVAIGHKSRDAAVATAGFFSRMARRVAGSF